MGYADFEAEFTAGADASPGRADGAARPEGHRATGRRRRGRALVSPPALRAPADQSADAVAYALLSEAARARARLADADDAEALHDFRVAVRRLRSWLRAFRRVGRARLPRKVRRRLARIGDATTPGRDAEVQSAWLRDERRGLSARQREGVAWLIERLDERKRAAEARFRGRVDRDFERVEAALESVLTAAEDARSDVPRDADGGAGTPTFATAAATLVRTYAAKLERSMKRVRSIGDQEEAHAARIAGKHLRYLLAPMAESVDGGKAVLKRLQALQDALGEMHDAHVLSAEVADAITDSAKERARRLADTVLDDDAGEDRLTEADREDAGPGLVAIAKRLRERAQRAFTAFEKHWQGAAGESLFREIDGVANALTIIGRARPALAPSVSDADGVEVERKFLLSGLPPAAVEAPAVEIEQGYIPGDRLAERLRRTLADGTERWYRTVKLGTGVARAEVEEETTGELFKAMWPLTEGRRVRKRRHVVADGSLRWEVDDFLDRELVIAEVELPTADARPEPPAWLAPFVVREVTDESDFQNVRLAR